MHWNDIATLDAQQLVESGLSRIHKHLADGRSLGIISAATGDKDQRGNEAAHRNMIRRLRAHGYGPIEAMGRAQWGDERSLVVPNARLDDMKKIGDEFGQQAIIHVPEGGKKNANRHWLAASGGKAGTIDDIGPEHFNVPNEKEDGGITILKGLGYKPGDTNVPARSFTFGDAKMANGRWVIEALTIPPGGQLNPLPKPYMDSDLLLGA